MKFYSHISVFAVTIPDGNCKSNHTYSIRKILVNYTNIIIEIDFQQKKYHSSKFTDDCPLKTIFSTF